MRKATAGWAVAIAILLAAAGTANALSLAPTWIVTRSVGEFDLGQGVAFAPDGSVLVAGTTKSGGDQDIILSRFAPNGTHVWTRTFDAGPNDRAEDVLVLDDRVYVAGAIVGPLADDALLLSYDLGGDLAWSASFDKGTAEIARGLALGGDGTLLMAGVSLSRYGADGFVAKLLANGSEVWSRPINMFYVDEAFAVASDPEGNAFVAGRLLREGSFDAFIRKFSPAGDVLWTRFVASGDLVEARGVAASSDGTACLAGTKAVGEGGARRLDLLVTCFSGAGDVLWEQVLDVTGDDDEGRAAAFDPSHNLVVTGFGRVSGHKNPFVLKLAPDGSEVWRHVASETGLAGAGAAAVSSDGARIAVAGASQAAGVDFDLLVGVIDQGAPSAAFRVLTSAPLVMDPVVFEDASFSSRAPLVSWSWDFGDGTRSTEANPSHPFAQAGTYTVFLTVRDAYNNLASHARTVVVAAPPPAETGTQVDEDAATGARIDAEGEDGQGEARTRGTPLPVWPALLALAAVGVALARRRG